MTDSSEPATGPPPEPIQDLAEACVRFVQAAVGLELDYTAETVPVLDHYLRQLPESTSDEVLGLMAPACGAYFGEVVRRHLEDGQWHCPSEDYNDWRLSFERTSIRFNPVGVALEVATAESVDGWSAQYEVDPADRPPARAAAASLGEVAPEDYYTFSVRLEVLEHLYHTLCARHAGSKPRTVG